MEKPRGLMKTILWTQLAAAIEMDFGVQIPDKAGPVTTQLISDVVDMISVDHTSLEQEK